MPFTGHNLYRGLGGLANVNFAVPLAQVAAGGQSQLVLQAAGHQPGATYTYVLRPVVNDAVSPDVSCAATFTTDAAGQWAGPPPAPPSQVTWSLRPTAMVRMQWRCDLPPGAPAPADFAIRVSRGLPVDTSAPPNLVIPYTGEGSYLVDVSTGLGSYYVALEARTAAQARSPAGLVGPIVVPPPPLSAPAVQFDAV